VAALLLSAIGSRANAAIEGVIVDAAVVALVHVRVVDGTGAAARGDQTIVIEKGRISAVGASATVRIPRNARTLDLKGRTVIPGLVGMHDHLFYPDGDGFFRQSSFSFSRLYLAAGVTSIRTAGSVEPYTDLEVKQLIDAGKMPGPKIHVTGPYLEGSGSWAPQMHQLTGADDARKTVEYWADEGVSSFKAYAHITRDELAAAISAAHKRGLKVTAHLCSIGFKEAVALGIDNLEHGPVFTDSDLVGSFGSGTCPEENAQLLAGVAFDPAGSSARALVHDLVSHKVAITSTLAVYETFLPNRPPQQKRIFDAMSWQAQAEFLSVRALYADSEFVAKAMHLPQAPYSAMFKNEMKLERAFVAAGGLLLAGADPTGNGGLLAGFADQREVELLVEAGFTPIEAIQIATANGAEFLGERDHIGTIARGKQADLVVIQGDPTQAISDIENVEIVFKDGVGYDSKKLLEAVRGTVGVR
jgi:imidazolonepropionase-like amidohydrolase